MGVVHWLLVGVVLRKGRGRHTEYHPQRFQWQSKGEDTIMPRHPNLSVNEAAADVRVVVVPVVGPNPPDGDGAPPRLDPSLVQRLELPDALGSEVVVFLFPAALHSSGGNGIPVRSSMNTSFRQPAISTSGKGPSQM